MSSVVVDGLALPVSVGGHPALDFCNTRAGWGSSAPKEYLQSYDHLLLWAREAALIEPDRAAALRRAALASPTGAHDVLAAALDLREATYAVALGDRSAARFRVVAERARVARAAAILRPQPCSANTEPGPLARWDIPRDEIDAPLLAISAQVDNLLCGPLAGVIAACGGIGCGWLFADPRRRRRWCDMAVCGNRAKARRHAQRRAAPDRNIGSLHEPGSR